MCDVWEDGGWGGAEGAASVRGVHDLAAVLLPCVPEGELERAQEGVQGEPAEVGGRGDGTRLGWRGLRSGVVCFNPPFPKFISIEFTKNVDCPAGVTEEMPV